MEGVFFGEETIFFFVHLAVSISLAFYMIFAFVMLRQVRKMTDTLEVGFESPLRFFAWIHFIFSISVFLISLVIL